LRDYSSIRVSRSVKDLAYKALQIREKLSKELQREPTFDEIAKRMNEEGEERTKKEIAEAMEAISEPISLYEPVFNEGGSSESLCVMDQVRDEKNTDDMWLEDIALREAMKRLNERERSIIDMRFYKGKTQMEIAEEIGISQAQVSRLEKGALDRIKKYM